MKAQIELPLITMESNIVNDVLKRFHYKINDSYHRVGIVVDIENLSEEAKILLPDGDTLPEIMYYWAQISMKTSIHAKTNNLTAYWLDIRNKKVYEPTIYTISELMSNTFLWENNSLDLVLVWGTLDELNLFNPNQSFDGFIIPLDSGLGLVSALNEASYNNLSKYFV